MISDMAALLSLRARLRRSRAPPWLRVRRLPGAFRRAVGLSLRPVEREVASSRRPLRRIAKKRTYGPSILPNPAKSRSEPTPSLPFDRRGPAIRRQICRPNRDPRDPGARSGAPIGGARRSCARTGARSLRLGDHHGSAGVHIAEARRSGGSRGADIAEGRRSRRRIWRRPRRGSAIARHERRSGPRARRSKASSGARSGPASRADPDSRGSTAVGPCMV